MPPASMRCDVLRQADHAVAVGALQVGLGHQPGDAIRVVGRKTHPLQRLGGESPQALTRNPYGFAIGCHVSRQSR